MRGLAMTLGALGVAAAFSLPSAAHAQYLDVSVNRISYPAVFATYPVYTQPVCVNPVVYTRSTCWPRTSGVSVVYRRYDDGHRSWRRNGWGCSDRYRSRGFSAHVRIDRGGKSRHGWHGGRRHHR